MTRGKLGLNTGEMVRNALREIPSVTQAESAKTGTAWNAKQRAALVETLCDALRDAPPGMLTKLLTTMAKAIASEMNGRDGAHALSEGILHTARWAKRYEL